MQIPSIGAVAIWARSPKASARIIRLVGTSGVLWTAVQFLDRFNWFKLPDGPLGISLFTSLTLALYGLIEIALLEATLRSHNLGVVDAFTPEEAFAAGILRYAEKLNEDDARRDAAVLELRAWSSRTLHLIGANQARHDLGQMALSAAINKDDSLTQASILIDELGWTMHLLNHDDEAVVNLHRAQSILGDLQNANGVEIESQLMTLKAMRHLVNIQADAHTIEEARSLFKQTRVLVESLPEPHKSVNMAQLDHSEGALILKHLDSTLGVDGRCDPTGKTSQLLEDGVKLARSSAAGFRSADDTEREMKSIYLLTGLLRHGRDGASLQSARQRLARLKQEAERTAYLP